MWGRHACPPVDSKELSDCPTALKTPLPMPRRTRVSALHRLVLHAQVVTVADDHG